MRRLDLTECPQKRGKSNVLRVSLPSSVLVGRILLIDKFGTVGNVGNARKMVLKTFLKSVYLGICKLILNPLLRYEWKHPPYRQPNERPVEFAFALKCLATLYPEDILDVGTGKTAWPHVLSNCGFQVTAFDQIKGYWSGSFFNRHFYVHSEDITNPVSDKTFDFVTCISVLEHIPDHQAAMAGIFKLLKPGGHVVLTCPYNEQEYVENVYLLPGSNSKGTPAYVCRAYSRRELDDWLAAANATVVEQEYYQVFTGPHWSVGDWCLPPRRVNVEEPHQLTCLLLQKQP